MITRAKNARAKVIFAEQFRDFRRNRSICSAEFLSAKRDFSNKISRNNLGFARQMRRVTFLEDHSRRSSREENCYSRIPPEHTSTVYGVFHFLVTSSCREDFLCKEQQVLLLFFTRSQRICIYLIKHRFEHQNLSLCVGEGGGECFTAQIEDNEAFRKAVVSRRN